MKDFYLYSNESLRNQYEGRKYSANSAEGQEGEFFGNSSENYNTGKPRLRCSHCNQIGHPKERCFKLSP